MSHEVDSPSDALVEHRRRCLASLLLARREDSIADITGAVNDRFFSPAHIPLPLIGHLFLSGHPAARRQNLTERLLFQDNTPKSPAIGGDRWIRGVLMASPSISPPPEAHFLHRSCNGRLLFGQTLLRVTGVRLPAFIPRTGTVSRAVTESHSPSITPAPERDAASLLEMIRLSLLNDERGLLKELKAFLRALLLQLQQERQHCEIKEIVTQTTPKGVLPDTLNVPVYYLVVHIEDTAASRLASVVELTNSFIDLIIDAEVSMVRIGTELLQDLVELSLLAEREGMSERYGNSLSALYSRASQAVAQLDVQRNRTLKEKSSRSLHNKSFNLAEAARCLFQWNPKVDFGSDLDGCVNLANVPLDDTPVVFNPTQHLTDGEEGIDDDEEEEEEGEVDGGTSSVFIVARKGFSDVTDSVHAKGKEVSHSKLKLPAILVHCMKGASRSPSIVMAYYLKKCAPQFRQLMETPWEFSFPHLLDCLREARPAVDPQPCFLAELRTMWSRLSRETEGVLVRNEDESNLIDSMTLLDALMDDPSVTASNFL